MLCRKPYKTGILEYGCGQCTPCRINKTRLWVGRMLLERYEHKEACFATLTYNEEHLPKNAYLSKRAAQLFIKRLRAEIEPRKLRYYIVGEYGDKSWRPHYHAILYGISPTEQNLIEKCWPFGFVKLGTAEEKTFSYVSGYIVKKMTQPKDNRLNNRPPEFALMSRNPGLGYGIVERMEKAYKTTPGKAALQKMDWVSETFHTTGFTYPLGRYLKEKIIEKTGFDKVKRKAHNYKAMLGHAKRQMGITVTQYQKERAARANQQRKTPKERPL